MGPPVSGGLRGVVPPDQYCYLATCMASRSRMLSTRTAAMISCGLAPEC